MLQRLLPSAGGAYCGASSPYCVKSDQLCMSFSITLPFARHRVTPPMPVQSLARGDDAGRTSAGNGVAVSSA